MNHATNTNNRVIPRLAFHLSAREQNGNSQAPLSKEESEIKKILSKVSRDTVVGQQILAGLSGDNTRFRILLSEFKDQLRDAEKHLQSIIGERAIELLKTIS
jgi:ATP-dependent protease HslVU (ClpYQ) peptidase subunit